MVEVEERPLTWKFVLAFLLGSLFAVITADPISDVLFFLRVSSGKPLSPLESVWYWYYLPALVYLGFLIAAYIAYRAHLMRPRVFIYLLLFLAGLGAWKSLMAFGFDRTLALLLFMPVVLLALGLLYRARIGGG
jgi:hypothetical protein